MSVSDLTGTKWALGETVTIDSASIRNYAINYSVEVNENQQTPSTLTGGTSFDIVYTNEYLPPEDAYLPVAYITINTEYSSSFGGAIYQLNGRIFERYNQTLPAVVPRTDATSITYVTAIFITGGTDATNANLISWLEANATLIETPEEIGSIAFGNNDIKSIYFGNNSVFSIFLGNKEIYKTFSITTTITNGTYTGGHV